MFQTDIHGFISTKFDWRENGPVSKIRETGHHMVCRGHSVFFFRYLLKISRGGGWVVKTEICCCFLVADRNNRTQPRFMETKTKLCKWLKAWNFHLLEVFVFIITTKQDVTWSVVLFGMFEPWLWNFDGCSVLSYSICWISVITNHQTNWCWFIIVA